MALKLLLLDDVDSLGRQGDVVEVKPGYARNYLLPQKKAVIADSNALRRQVRLQEERAKKAAEDKKEALLVVEMMKEKSYLLKRKVDEEGHMYGSVSIVDIVELLAGDNIIVEKHNVVLSRPIKMLGTHTINLKLKEEVICSFDVEVEAE